MAERDRTSLCVRCDNRHGCRSPAPPCQLLDLRPDEAGLAGQALMRHRGLLLRCTSCAHFHLCWHVEEHRRALYEDTAAGRPGRPRS